MVSDGELLDAAVAASSAPWVRRRHTNGTFSSWRLPVAGTSPPVDICVWPINSGYRLSNTDSESTWSLVVGDAQKAVRLAEYASALGVVLA